MEGRKNEAIESLLDSISTMAWGNARSDSLATQRCVMCKGPATEFKDALSRKEYAISSLCQECQDMVFQEFPEEEF